MQCVVAGMMGPCTRMSRPHVQRCPCAVLRCSLGVHRLLGLCGGFATLPHACGRSAMGLLDGCCSHDGQASQDGTFPSATPKPSWLRKCPTPLPVQRSWRKVGKTQLSLGMGSGDGRSVLVGGACRGGGVPVKVSLRAHVPWKGG